MGYSLFEEFLRRVLVYNGVRQHSKDVPIEGYVDSDYVDCLHTRKSLSLLINYCIWYYNQLQG